MKTLLIYSGGMDSTVLLYWLKFMGRDVSCLGIDYGQRHGKELLHAAELAEKNNVPFRVADLSALRPLLGGSSQTDDTVEVPEGHYAAESMKLTVVPNRNMIMLAVAAGHAVSLGCDTVAYAAHAGDHAIYPDCRPEFATALDGALALADWKPVRLERPFIQFTKSDIAKLGRLLLAPLQDTWSCYKGGELHCGRCGTCVERQEALAGFDSTRYENPMPKEDLPF
jgi:7-cyano-7-deazaguanine synthase